MSFVRVTDNSSKKRRSIGRHVSFSSKSLRYKCQIAKWIEQCKVGLDRSNRLDQDLTTRPWMEGSWGSREQRRLFCLLVVEALDRAGIGADHGHLGGVVGGAPVEQGPLLLLLHAHGDILILQRRRHGRDREESVPAEARGREEVDQPRGDESRGGG